MAGYIRQSSFVDGDTITAALFNNEFNQMLNAFSNTGGHKHDGTAAEGPVIGLIGDAGETAPNNKVLIDTTNNFIEFYVQVSSNPVQQLYIADGAIIPVTDSDVDLGTTSLRFKDTYTDTITTTGNVSVGGNLTVTGTTTFNGGTITMGDAATDNVVFGADIDSNIIPDDDNTYDLGSTSQEWRNLYIDGTANIDSLVADTADINGGTVDGAIIGGSSAAAITGTTITGTSFVIGSADISEAELETIDGVTAGTVAASKAVVVDANKDFTGARNITLTGELDAGSLDVSGDVDIDGTTNLDVVDIDGAVDMATTLTVGGEVTAASLDISGNVDIDGTLETDALSLNGTTVTASAADINLIDGITNGTVIASKAIVTDANIDITGGRNITISGELDAATLDISGDADIDGTLEADAITIAGVTLAETISDTVGAMVSSNTESGITVAYDDADNTLDFTVGTLNQNTTGSAATLTTARTIGGVSFNGSANIDLPGVNSAGNQNTSGTAAIATTVTITDNESTNENNAIVFTAGGDLDGGNLGLESDGDLKYNPSTGTLSATNISVSGTLSTVDSVTMSANNAVVFEGATADAHETTLTVVDATADRTITLPNVSGTVPVLAAASNTQITSTPEELNALDGITAVVGELNALDIGSTAVGTAVASKAVILDSNKDYIDGVLETDNLTIGGAQGTDGQVLTSTGSGVAWEDSGSGGATFKTFGTSSIMIGDNATGTIDAANYNVGVGIDVFAALTSGDDNVAVGFGAAAALTTGVRNVFVGEESGSVGTSTSYSVGIGREALKNATGDNNTAVGYVALKGLTTGTNNVAVGRSAMTGVVTGADNVAIGYGAGGAITSGAANTAVGANALDANTTGNSNIAIGKDAVTANTSGAGNIGIGVGALRANTTAGEVTGVGDGCLAANTSGASNTAFGAQALAGCTTGSSNIAVGNYALNDVTTGTNNVAVGIVAGDAITTGIHNVALGNYALTANTTGELNTAIGHESMFVSTTTVGNVGVGRRTLYGCTTADNNTAIGYLSGYAATTGAQNTTLGTSSGQSTPTTGSHNLLLGFSTNSGVGGSVGRIVIGDSFAGTSDTRVHIGNGTSHIYNDYNSNATWTHSSDERSKKDIESSALGLDFINELKPVTYKFKAPSEYPQEWESYNVDKTKPSNQNTQHGMIAQDVKEALDKFGIEDFKGWDVLPDGKQQISEAMFVFPLIKAMQELSTQVDELKSELLALKGE
jgi:cytoskeletal protein CcmA (bactofilin family)